MIKRLSNLFSGGSSNLKGLILVRRELDIRLYTVMALDVATFEQTDDEEYVTCLRVSNYKVDSRKYFSFKKSELNLVRLNKARRQQLPEVATAGEYQLKTA